MTVHSRRSFCVLGSAALLGVWSSPTPAKDNRPPNSNDQDSHINRKFQNPILPGFNPDPSICRVGEDYYLSTSSFIWFPGMPVYHSRDLVNWQLIGHGLDRAGLINFDGIKDKDGIWAVTIRHHDGLFYLVSTAHDCGGQFYVTAKDPRGPWSDPVWLNDAPGIDSSLMWDDDGKCYFTANTWNFPKDFKKSWPAQTAIWMQELDLSQKKLVGERRVLTYGYGPESGYMEGPHVYKIGSQYLLITAQGGEKHEIAAYHSKSVWGEYVAEKTNPVLSHQRFGSKHPIQGVGHADLVQTQHGEWWAVALGKRVVDGEFPLARETFLCEVKFVDGTPVFCPGHGQVLLEQDRPNLPWTPVKTVPARDEFDTGSLAPEWHFVRVPNRKFHQVSGGKLTVELGPQTVDGVVNTSMIIRRIEHHHFFAASKLSFSAAKANEEAGIIIHRTGDNYFTLMKTSSTIVLAKKHDGKKEIIATLPYSKPDVYFSVTGMGLDVNFSIGESADTLIPIGGTESLAIISENKNNKFNGVGIGVYATSNGAESNNHALYDWFEYRKYSLARP
ncbi:glycoside hydrolase family 43 protein [Undibacterium sp. Di26W]|uniref:glycoside hydrolase family 43 protein n=1 Tax=Undibacterium sp. Di26W TaxID=3413035 RepID=UPI003BF235FE